MGETADEPAVVEADGQVTAQKNVALGMFAADCLPVLMADPEAGVIGAAHCGRRGLQNGVIGATIEKMVSKGARPERIVATLARASAATATRLAETLPTNSTRSSPEPSR
mgnify:CR=1 FL=1